MQEAVEGGQGRCPSCSTQLSSNSCPTGLAWSSQGAVEDRNRNYASIMRNLNFSSRGWYDVQSQVDEVDDHVKRKVSMSPGCWNSCNLLPSWADSSGHGHFGSLAAMSATERCTTRGWLVHRWLLQPRLSENALHCAPSPVQRG